MTKFAEARRRRSSTPLLQLPLPAALSVAVVPQLLLARVAQDITGDLHMVDKTYWLERAGVHLTPEELKFWEPAFDYYIEALKRLRALKLDGVEAGFVFRAAWDTEA